MRYLAWALLAANLFAFGCSGGDDDDDDAPPDSGPTDTGADTGVNDTGVVPDTGVRDTGPADMGTTGPIVVEVGDPYGEEEVINPAGDTDMFQFEGVAGQWLRIITRSGGSPVDPVITLFDSDMTQLAENDDDIPRTGTDSEINFHVPENGTYFVMVQEFSSWDDGSTPVGGADYTYTLRVLIWDDEISGTVIDPETGDDAASATPDEFGTVLGTFRDPNDVDVYRVRIASSTIAQYSVTVLPSGPDGQGSTSPAGDVWLTDLAGAETIARVNNAAGIDVLDPPVTPGEYLLWIAHPGANIGSNDYYVMRPGLFGDNPLERGDPTNDTMAGAEALEITVDAATGRRSRFVLARLPDADVDYFVVDAMDTEMLSVACGAESSGSGVRGLTAEVRDATDAVLQTAMEDELGLLIMAFAPPAAGTYYVRLSAGTPAADVTSRFVRCGLHAAPPPP